MRSRLALTVLLLLSVSANAAAADAGATEAKLRARLEKSFPGLKVQNVSPSPVPGLYEFTAEGDLMYVSADGRYLVDAQIIDIDKRINVTEAKRAGERKAALARLDEKQMIIFAPPSYQHTVTVFTDTDCGYCQKLHSEMQQLNKLGIRVRYLAYPRSGPGTEGWRTMEAVWCAQDRKAAMTRAKSGQTVVAQKNCGASPVGAQYELGDRLGVKGTPAIFTESGNQIGGYVPAARMLETLQKEKG